MPLLAAAITPPAEHTARRPAGAADAAAADANVSFTNVLGLDKSAGMIYCNT